MQKNENRSTLLDSTHGRQGMEKVRRQLREQYGKLLYAVPSPISLSVFVFFFFHHSLCSNNRGVIHQKGNDRQFVLQYNLNCRGMSWSTFRTFTDDAQCIIRISSYMGLNLLFLTFRKKTWFLLKKLLLICTLSLSIILFSNMYCSNRRQNFQTCKSLHYTV